MIYNWKLVVIGVAVLLLIVFGIKSCIKKDDVIIESPKPYIDSLLIENRALERAAKEIEAKRINDSIRLTKELDYYKALKRKERIVYVAAKVGGDLVDQDTLTCFNDRQLDSVSTISIERDFCYVDRDELRKLNSIKDAQIFNSDKTLAKSILYSTNLESLNKSLRKDRDKQVTKKRRNAKIAVVATIVAVAEGYLLFLR